MSDRLSSTDPATGETVGEVDIASSSDVDAAIDRARDAQADWANRRVRDRAAIIERFMDVVLARRDEAAELVTHESGKPLVESMMADVMPALEIAKYLVSDGARVLKGETFRLGNPLLMDRTSSIEHEPLGVLGVIAPWNYPLAIPATGVLTGLLAGNSVILKPAEQTPLIGQWMVEALHEAGVPSDVLHVVHGYGETGAAVVEGDTDGILFTGSVETGHRVAEACLPTFKPHTLELGGKDPMIVCEDARLDLAVRGALWGGFTNAGQTCAAVERVYVHESLHDEFVERLVEQAERLRVGPGLSGDVDMGPLIEDEAVKRIDDQVRDADKRGATVATGGRTLDDIGPRFYAPTVLTDVSHEMDVKWEETFGPIVPVMPVADDDEAIEWANDTKYGLSASVWSRDTARAEAIGRRLQAGTFTLNDCVYTYAAAETPWGGVAESGVGFTHGEWGLEAVTRLKHINRSRANRARSPWYYPYTDQLDDMLDSGMQFLYGGLRGKLGGMKVLGPLLKRLRG